MQNCIFAGVNYSSPTLASALSNLVPALTFLLAVIFRFFSFLLIHYRLVLDCGFLYNAPFPYT